MQKLKESVSGIISFHQKNKYEDTEPSELVSSSARGCDRGQTDLSDTKRKKKPWSLPHWCIYIAWTCE